jgi:hypothetical protein
VVTQTISASQSGHSRDLVQASAALTEQGLGYVKALGDEPLAGGSACRLVEATKEGAGTHPTFRRHTGDRPTSREIGPHPIEQRGDVSLLSHPHGPLEKLRLPAVAMRRHDQTASDRIGRAGAEILADDLDEQIDAGSAAGGCEDPPV